VEIDRQIIPDKNRVVVRVVGRVGFEQFRQVFDEVLADESFLPNMDILWDLNDAVVEASVIDVRKVVQHIHANRKRRGSDYKTALVATGGANTAASKLFKLFASILPFETLVFSSRAEAELWLDGKLH